MERGAWVLILTDSISSDVIAAVVMMVKKLTAMLMVCRTEVMMMTMLNDAGYDCLMVVKRGDTVPPFPPFPLILLAAHPSFTSSVAPPSTNSACPPASLCSLQVSSAERRRRKIENCEEFPTDQGTMEANSTNEEQEQREEQEQEFRSKRKEAYTKNDARVGAAGRAGASIHKERCKGRCSRKSRSSRGRRRGEGRRRRNKGRTFNSPGKEHVGHMSDRVSEHAA
eukprot:1080-Hanusia_phi.AAC.1